MAIEGGEEIAVIALATAERWSMGDTAVETVRDLIAAATPPIVNWTEGPRWNATPACIVTG